MTVKLLTGTLSLNTNKSCNVFMTRSGPNKTANYLNLDPQTVHCFCIFVQKSLLIPRLYLSMSHRGVLSARGPTTLLNHVELTFEQQIDLSLQKELSPGYTGDRKENYRTDSETWMIGTFSLFPVKCRSALVPGEVYLINVIVILMDRKVYDL